ncbi:MAG: hypothetical protein JWQ79_3285 [Mucilaginibacter sp.]|nr:hypothetical protein [Mucilaginibacter sp.]
MKKYLLLLMLGLSINPLFAQVDSALSKYSYLLVGIKSSNNKTQTIYPLCSCFFTRRNKELYLVTAKHCINDFNGFNLKPTESNFDTIGFRYYNSILKQTAFSRLVVRGIKKYLPNDFFYEDPDFVFLKMTDTIVDKFVFSMEKYLQDTIKNDYKIDSIVSFGYGLKDPTTFSIKTTPMHYSGVLANKTNIDPYYPVNNNIYYVIQPQAIQGMSGAPVFLLCSSSNDSKTHIVFGGVLFGTNSKYNSAYIVDPNVFRYHYLVDK